MNVAVIGGGFFGLYIARHMALKGFDVDLFERESTLMTRASWVNQARIHNGYHYPRSILTANRSHQSFPVFCEDFPGCVYDEFDKYYAISRKLSKVNASLFEGFCRKVGIECTESPKHIKEFFDPLYIENVYTVKEYAFDYKVLRDEILNKIDSLNIQTFTNTSVEAVQHSDCNRMQLQIDGEKSNKEYTHVFNCTYASINIINKNSKISEIPLIHEMAELSLIQLPEEMKGLGITVMCGPFFSAMPFPSEGLHSFTHVRYTPARESSKIDSFKQFNSRAALDRINHTSYAAMMADASRYMPVLKKSTYVKSIWDIKTILPSSENDDSRPILFKPNHDGKKGYHCIMGGKIDNVYDATAFIDNEILTGN